MNEENEKIEIVYSRPPLHRRMFASLLDLIIFVAIGFLLFLAARAVVYSLPYHNECMNTIETFRKDSGIYEKYNNEYVLLPSYLNTNLDLSSQTKMERCEGGIDKFINFSAASNYGGSIELQDLVVKDYEEFRLSLSYNGHPYFIKDSNSGELIKNSIVLEAIKYEGYYNDCYSVYIISHADSILGSKFAPYYYANQFLNRMLLLVEIPIGFLLSGIITYMVPPLIFKRGHKTLGKLTYHIGVVGPDYLNLSTKRFLFRFLLFYFSELILSVFTFAIPAIISFTMMAFTKNKQSFHDYMLDYQEVETYNNKSYLSYEEIRVDQVQSNKKPVDFRPINKE